MPSVNTNLSSLIVQTNLKSSTKCLNIAIERMSTGFKINHAKDNAANYSIKTKLSSKISSYEVAEDNAMMGLDMLETSSEALNHMEENLARIRSLAVQAQNGTYGEKSLIALNSEAQALMNEISRLNETAQYNGIKLFNTGKAEITNAGKELELNEQGFLQEVIVRDTSTMTKLSTVDETQALAKGAYSISTLEEFLKLANMANSGLLEAGSEFILANDIDLAEYCKEHEGDGGWCPISNFNSMTFDGNGHVIKNLYINRPFNDYQGLFSSLSNSKVLNLKLENVNITAKNNVGAITGYATGWSGIINNCVVDGKLTGTGNSIAGIEGSAMYASCKYCYVDVDVTGKNNIGGISGYLHTTGAVYCYSKGIISGVNRVGGIAGEGDDVENSRSEANVAGQESVGGIIGSAQRVINDAYFSGNVFGMSAVGGISGYAIRGIDFINCIVDGTITGENKTGVFMGAAAESTSSIVDCWYYQRKCGDVLVGEDNISVENVRDMTVPAEYSLQVGINSDLKASSITLTTFVDFSVLSSLLQTGIEDESVLKQIDTLVNQVSLKQTEIGTAQNRLASVLEEISIKYDNLVSSRSTIQDADIAEKSSAYIRNQILQQAAATLLATANQTPSIALQLL